MTRKSIIVLILAVAVVAGAWASGASDEEAAGGEEQVTLRVLSYFTAGDNSTPIYNDIFEQMEADFPGLTIEHEGLESASARDKLAIEMASGNPPDVSFMVQGLGRQYAEEGLLLNLEPYISADSEWQDAYYPSALEAFTWDGEIYLVPSHAHFGGLYYNRAVLERVGIDAPAQTWDELLDHVRTIRAAGVNPFLTGGREFRYAWLTSQILVRTAGVDAMDALYFGDQQTEWDDPDNGLVEALERVQELADAGAFPEDIAGLSRNVARLMFAQDEGAYWYEGTWKVGVFAGVAGEDFLDRLGWTTFPTIPGAAGDQTGGVGGPLLGWGVSSRVEGRQRDLAVELVKRLEDRDSATRQLAETQQPTGTRPFPEALDSVHPLLETILSAYGEIPRVAYPTDVASVPPVDNAIKRIAVPGIIEGSLTPAEAAREVALRADEFFTQ